MDYPIITDSSIPNYTSNTSNSSSYNLNFKTMFLFVILICACCLLSIGFNFKINKLFDLEGISFWACLTLTMFLFYVLYEFFKSDTCDDLKKLGSERLVSAFGRGRNYIGQQGTNGLMRINNYMNPNQYSNPTQNQYSNPTQNPMIQNPMIQNPMIQYPNQQ